MANDETNKNSFESICYSMTFGNTITAPSDNLEQLTLKQGEDVKLIEGKKVYLLTLQNVKVIKKIYQPVEIEADLDFMEQTSIYSDVAENKAPSFMAVSALLLQRQVVLKVFSDGEADVLIGTQMIVKGHDFPRVTLVGVLLADLSLNEADYRSSEKTFQLITQAVGRAGRAERPGEAVIQTYQPEHFAIRAAAAQDYGTFYREELAYRSVLRYPPCGEMLAVLGEARDGDLLRKAMTYLRRFIDRIDPSGVLMAIGPAPQSIGRIRDNYREVIYMRSVDRKKLIRAKDLLEEYIAANKGFQEIHVMFDFS